MFDKGTPALNGTAIRKQVTIVFSKEKSDSEGAPKADLLIYLPANARGPVPLLLNIGFTANSATIDDPGIKPGEVWNREKNARVPATVRPQGRLNVAPFLAQGIGVATIYYGDIEPDFAEGFPIGVRKHFLKPGQTQPAPDEWGAIAAWGWGLSRAMDYLETDKGVDAKRVAIVGISRLGKTVLWAGARDTRFAMVIASCSGESGAALSRRNYGETVKHMTARFGYQFAANYAGYGDRVAELPVDAHMLVASIAPRPLLLQTGDKDFWSDPKGEFLSAVAAGPVYTLLGKEALGTDQMPPGRHADLPHARLRDARRRARHDPVRLGSVPAVHADALADQRWQPLAELAQGMLSSLCALPQTIFWKTAGVVDRFSSVSVSRATHLPAMREAAGLLF